LAVRINRQPGKIALVGVPSSAGAHGPGVERAPEALRAAGLADRLRALGFEVTDLGDCPAQVFQPDDEHPRARNAAAVVATLEALKPRVEQGVKSGALVLILGGECTLALAVIAGVKRYYRNVNLVWCDRDADLNIPATSPSGCLHGMAVAHIVGRGAPELVRFWSEPPLVRPPEITLFGLERLDPPERELLEQLPMRPLTAPEVQQKGAATAAQAVVERIPEANQFVLHLDVDVIASEEFAASEVPGPGGLSLEDMRQALEVFARQKNLTALEVAGYNPERDPDGAAAKVLVELLASALAARFTALAAPPVEAPAAEPQPAAAETPAGVVGGEESAAVAAQPAPAEIAEEVPAPSEVAETPPESLAEATSGAEPAPAEAQPPAAETPAGVVAGEESAAVAAQPAPAEIAEEVPAPSEVAETPPESLAEATSSAEPAPAAEAPAETPAEAPAEAPPVQEQAREGE
jgi:arginase